MLGRGTYFVLCTCVLLKTYCAWCTSRKRKTEMHTWHGQQKEACTSALLAAPPGSCDLLATAGPTRQGDDTPTLTYLAKAGPTALSVRGLSRHLVQKRTQLRMSSLRDPTRHCAGCGRQCSRGTAGALETQRTCASVRSWNRS